MATYRHDPDAAWFAAVRGGVILVVPVEAANELATLWTDFPSGDPTSRVLDRLTAQGLGATPPFALVVRDESAGSARVVVRGPIVVRSGSTVIGGAGVSTWTERVIEGSGALTVEVEVDGADQHPGASLPIVEAVVPAISVTSEGIEVVAASASAGAGTAPATAPTSAAVPTPTRESTPVSTPAAPSPAPASPVPMRPPPPPVPTAATAVAEQTVAKPSKQTASPAPSAQAPSVPAEQTMVSVEETVAGVSTPAEPISAIVPPAGFASSAAAGVPAVESDFDGDHDGMTVASVDIRRLREQRAAQAGVTTPAGGVAAASGTPQATLRMPDGTLEPIGHEVVLGRAPSVSKVSGGRIPRLLTIGAGDPDISRSHVRLTLEGDTVVITDLHSRNGTHVVAPGKAPVKLRSGEPTPVLTGTVVDLGGGWTVQVVGG